MQHGFYIVGYFVFFLGTIVEVVTLSSEDDEHEDGDSDSEEDIQVVDGKKPEGKFWN
jgi:hypothetical protein